MRAGGHRQGECPVPTGRGDGRCRPVAPQVQPSTRLRVVLRHDSRRSSSHRGCSIGNLQTARPAPRSCEPSTERSQRHPHALTLPMKTTVKESSSRCEKAGLEDAGKWVTTPALGCVALARQEQSHLEIVVVIGLGVLVRLVSGTPAHDGQAPPATCNGPGISPQRLKYRSDTEYRGIETPQPRARNSKVEISRRSLCSGCFLSPSWTQAESRAFSCRFG